MPTSEDPQPTGHATDTGSGDSGPPPDQALPPDPAPTPIAGVAAFAALAPRLYAATDALNAELARVEEALRGFNLRVGAAVPLRPEDPRGEALAFRRLGAAWHLVLEGPGGEGQRGLRNGGSREERVAGARALDRLIARVFDASEELARDLERAAGLARRAAARIEAMRGEPAEARRG